MDDTRSPLEQAEAARRQRDIIGEVEALTQGHGSLTSTPWYPPQEGDLVYVHYPALTDGFPGWGETYEIAADTTGELRLRLLHDTAQPGDPLMEIWMEAGPQGMSVVHAGQRVPPTP